MPRRLLLLLHRPNSDLPSGCAILARTVAQPMSGIIAPQRTLTQSPLARPFTGEGDRARAKDKDTFKGPLGGDGDNVGRGGPIPSKLIIRV